jgi:hypothetical protein
MVLPPTSNGSKIPSAFPAKNCFNSVQIRAQRGVTLVSLTSKPLGVRDLG